MPVATARPPRRPLLVTSDEHLLDELLRLAAAGGAEVDVATDPAGARGRYSTAPLVVVGSDQAAACVRAGLPRRTDVLIAARATDKSDPWEQAEPLGAAHVAILPAAQPWLVDRFAGSRTQGGPARVVAVVGGRGGAGASVLAAGLSVTAATIGRRSLLVDGDPLGGGLDLLLGWEERGGLRWPELTETSGRVDGPALLDALPGHGELAVLSFDRREPATATPAAMAAVLAAGRAARDLVVVDLPRAFDPTAVVALQTADCGLLVVPAELRAVTAAARVVEQALAHCAEVSLVVRGPAPGRLTAEEISRTLGLPIAGLLRPETSLPATLEDGTPPAASGRGPLAQLCRTLVAGWLDASPAVAA